MTHLIEYVLYAQICDMLENQNTKSPLNDFF